MNDEVYFADGYATTYNMKTSATAGQAIVLDPSRRSSAFDPALLLNEGADSLIGGTGNDTYVVDNAGDAVTELAGEGTDSVQSYLATYTLGANVENLMLMGFSNSNATGNDTLIGGAGNDYLVGGVGNDTYIFNRGDGIDTWYDFDSNVNNQDTARFGSTICFDQIWLKRNGSHLEV